MTDPAGFLSPPTRATLVARLEAYQQRTGHQVVVWIGGTLGGAPLDQWATRTFAAWALGQKGKDDGLAVFILVEDLAIAIEVGYGLEAQVTDALSSRIIGELLAPRMRAGDPDGAATSAIDALLAAIEGEPVAGLSPTPSEEKRPEPGLTEWVIGALLVVLFIALFITHPRLALLLLWSILSGRSPGRGGGGFRGGGGRSGGGGARGRW